MTKSNLFQTIPETLKYDDDTPIINKNIALDDIYKRFSEKRLFQNLRKPLQQDDNTTISDILDNRQQGIIAFKNKKIYAGLGLLVCVLLLFFIISRSFLTQSNQSNINNAFKKIKNTDQILKPYSKSDMRALFDTAQDLEKSNSPIKGLKYRLQGINNYIQASDYETALKESQIVDSIFDTQFLDKNDNITYKLRIYHYNFLSEIYYRLNNPQQAVAYSKKSLENSLAYYGQDSLKTAKQYELMAFNLDNIGDFDKALKLRHNAVDIRLRYHGNKVKIDEGNLIADMNNLGEEYRTLGYFAESKEILLQAINRIEKKHGIDAPELIVVLNNLGLTYQESDNKIIALSYLQQAYQLAHRHYGNDHDLTHIISKNITHLRGFRL